MYHPGKVIEIFKAEDKDVESMDSSTQAMLEMWDENLITVLVEPNLHSKISKNDLVLVDYRPMENKPAPKLIVNKVIKGNIGKNIWATYKDFHSKRKQGATNPFKTKQNYVG